MIFERQFSFTTKFLSFLFGKLLNRVNPKLLINDLISREHKLTVARFENCKLGPRRIATIKSRRYGARTLKYYVWPICLVARRAVSKRFRVFGACVCQFRLFHLVGFPFAPVCMCVSVPNEKRYVSHRQLTWVNYKRTSGLCSARMNLLAR